MVDVYYYLPSGEVSDIVECGLKLSKWFDKETYIYGDLKKCMSTLLNPRDDLEKYRSADYKCVKLELHSDYCFIADRYLYDMGLHHPQVMEMYRNSIIPVEKYVFGFYRKPECLVTSTVIPGQIHVLNRKIDSPVLYDNSEELYINNIIENYREKYRDFNDTMLYSFYCRLAENGIVDRIEDSENKIALFIDKTLNRFYTIKVPDMTAL